METPLLDIHNIDLYREKVRVFKDFSITIPAGKNCVILGPNGCGKTSLIMLLTRGLYPAYKNQSWIKILGQSMWNVQALHAHMGIVSFDLQKHYPEWTTGIEVILSGFFQSRGIYAHQNITKEMETSSQNLMEELHIIRLQNQAFTNMSTGEQRLCLLGRALINNPSHLILDEPTSGLDLKNTLHYLNIIQELTRKGKTIILVTHHINEIIPTIDLVYLMRQGKIIKTGSKEDILTSDILSYLYETEIEVFSRDGYYYIAPIR